MATNNPIPEGGAPRTGVPQNPSRPTQQGPTLRTPPPHPINTALRASQQTGRRDVVRLQGGSLYRTVQARLKEFRDTHPLWTIDPKIVQLDPTWAVFRVDIRDEEGRLVAAAHAHAFASMGDNFVEVAETSAIGRALNLAGFYFDEIETTNEEG